MSRLFIAEKQSLGEAIANGLGVVKKENGYISCKNGDAVTWLAGHVLEMLMPSDIDPKWKTWSMDTLPITPSAYPKRPHPSKTRFFNTVKALVADSRFDTIVNAGDPDREGQLLVDELLQYLKNKKKEERILVNATDIKTVQKALSNIKPNKDFQRLTESGEARERADFALGMTLSRAMSIKLKEAGGEGVSVGRVQTPTLALVVQRQDEIDNFKPTPYWQLKAEITSEAGKFTANWMPSDEIKKDNEGRVIDEQAVDAVIKRIGHGPKNGIIASVTEKPEKREPPRPFSLTGFQKAMSKYGVKLKESLAIAQKLYDSGFTTYPRSAHDTLPASLLDDAADTIKAIAASGVSGNWQNALKKVDLKIKSKVWIDNFTPEHHAIIPTGKAPRNLSDKEMLGYMEIAARYIWQFLPPMEGLRTTVIVDSPLEQDPEHFTASGLVVQKPGWQEFSSLDGLKASNKTAKTAKRGQEDEDDQEEEEDKSLPPVKQGEKVGVEPKKEKKETKPPHPFTQSSLITAMEKIGMYVEDPKIKKLLMSKEVQGIGTAATRTAIIEGLLAKGLMSETKNKLAPTDTGRSLIYTLRGTPAEEFIKPETTGVWEMTLQEMAEGKGISLAKFMDGMEKSLVRAVDNIRKMETNAIAANITLDECPECHEQGLKRIKGKFGFFWKCLRCSSTFKDEKGKVGAKSGSSGPKPTAPCPICQGEATLFQLKDGGEKWHCDKCGTWMDNVDGAPFAEVAKCPLCSQPIIKKTAAKSGSTYWTCAKCNKAFFSPAPPTKDTYSKDMTPVASGTKSKGKSKTSGSTKTTRKTTKTKK